MLVHLKHHSRCDRKETAMIPLRFQKFGDQFRLNDYTKCNVHNLKIYAKLR